MGCGGSKEAVATGNSGSSRCNRFKRKSSVVDATQPSSRVLQPSLDNASAAAAAKASNGEVTKDKAATLKQKAVEEKKEEAVAVKNSKEAVSVKEGNAASSKASAIREEKQVETKTDEAAAVTDAASEAVAAAVEKAGKEALAGKAAREKEGDEVVDFEAPESPEAHLCAGDFSARACQKFRKFMLVPHKPVFAGFLQGG